jgi:hypothetical protein
MGWSNDRDNGDDLVVVRVVEGLWYRRHRDRVVAVLAQQWSASLAVLRCVHAGQTASPPPGEAGLTSGLRGSCLGGLGGSRRRDQSRQGTGPAVRATAVVTDDGSLPLP